MGYLKKKKKKKSNFHPTLNGHLVLLTDLESLSGELPLGVIRQVLTDVQQVIVLTNGDGQQHVVPSGDVLRSQLRQKLHNEQQK